MIAKIYHYLDKKYFNKNYLFFHKFFKLFLNVFYPIYVLFTKRKKMNNDSNIIVSFTSFPARIKKVNLVVESMLRQTKMPNKIILYLSLKQFIGFDDLPFKLKKLVKNGFLEVEFVDDDYRSHKKYFYAIEKYNRNKCIITIDDDMIYPEDLIEIFEKAEKKYKDNVCCLWADKITIKNKKIESYNKWTMDVEKKVPKFNIMPIGCAGVLYPKKVFKNELLLKPDVFMKLCPLADDIWLKFNTSINNVKSVRLDDYNNFVFIDLLIKNNKKLCDENVSNSKNDEQVKNLIKIYPEFIEKIEEEL